MLTPLNERGLCNIQILFFLKAQNLFITKLSGTLTSKLIIGAINSEIYTTFTQKNKSILFKNNPVNE